MERRAAWARSRSSASSASVTRTPIVRVRRSDSPSRGLAMLSLTRLGPYRFGRDPSQQQAGQVAIGELITEARNHSQREGAIRPFVLKLVAGVAPGQRAQRHRAAHEAQIGVRFAGPDQLVYLIGNGEAPPPAGGVSRSAWMGPPRSAKASPIGIKPSRLDCMAHSLTPPEQDQT